MEEKNKPTIKIINILEEDVIATSGIDAGSLLPEIPLL